MESNYDIFVEKKIFFNFNIDHYLFIGYWKILELSKYYFLIVLIKI